MSEEIDPRAIAFADWLRDWWEENENKFGYMSEVAFAIVQAKADEMGIDLETSGAFTVRPM